MNSPHHFHIPVLGVGYSIDSPLKVARYGITSVVSLVDDVLMEDMRAFHSAQNGINYIPITEQETDHRAKRITAYLNMMQEVISGQMASIKKMPFTRGSDLTRYFELLPANTALKKKYLLMTEEPDPAKKEQLQQALRHSIVPGDIDANIMCKVDNPAYDTSGERLPAPFSDALSALRGFANSTLSSSVVFSAGYNPALFNYVEQFEDFYPSTGKTSKKKIILKVSDYRSALVQGKIFAKKGLWVSEFRIESGLNCGGHAFPTDGFVLGPVLQEFKDKRYSMAAELFDLCNRALAEKGKNCWPEMPIQKISAQGGVGTAEEHQFLLNHFQLDSIGWGSPFLLVPEVTNVDEVTLQDMAEAEPGDYYLSNASPLGVPFNNFSKSSSEVQRKNRIEKNRGGSPCYKKYLTSNTEFTDLPICTASRQYQQLKHEQLKAEGLPSATLNAETAIVAEKDCLCEGLSAAVRIKNGIELSHKLSAVTICPGPNLAWFSGIFSLKEMVDHIYGRSIITNSRYRPHMFVNELRLYLNYFKSQVEKAAPALTDKQQRYFEKFSANLLCGIEYYKKMFSSIAGVKTIEELSGFQEQILKLASLQQRH